MSDKDRRKKDGQDTNKQNQTMREAVQERHGNAAPLEPSADEGDIRTFKSGAANDRTI